MLTQCWGMQDLPKQLDRAAQRAELDRRVAGLPFAMPEIARRTCDEDLYFSIIADRRVACTAPGCSPWHGTADRGPDAEQRPASVLLGSKCCCRDGWPL